MAKLSFSAEIHIRGINPYVMVNKLQAEQLKPHWRRPLPVAVRINGLPKKPWHINMMPVGDGDFYLYLHGDVRKASATKVGDIVTVEVDFDESYKGGPDDLPAWLAEALEANQTAQQNWAKLSPSRQKEVVRYLSALKSDESRQRNLEKTLAVLSGQPMQFMGRAWRNGQ